MSIALKDGPNNRLDDNQPRPTTPQIVGYLIIIPLIFTTLMTFVLGFSLGLFDFKPQIKALQSFGHNLPLLGGVIPAPLPTEEEIGRLSLEEEKATLLQEWVLLDSERKRLEQRGRELDQQAQALVETAQQLSQLRDQYNNRDDNVLRLVQAYEMMKPVDAARLLDELPNEAVLEILVAMDITQVSRILAAMNSTKAVEISELMRR